MDNAQRLTTPTSMTMQRIGEMSDREFYLAERELRFRDSVRRRENLENDYLCVQWLQCLLCFTLLGGFR